MDKNKEPVSALLGTRSYFSPDLDIEVENHELINFSQASDVYAMGKIIHDLVNILSQKTIEVFVLKTLKQRKEYLNFVRELTSLIKQMQEPDPQKRITAQEVVEKLNNILKTPAYKSFISRGTVQGINKRSINKVEDGEDRLEQKSPK